MAYQVALLNFEGPLDLLLQLIERSELSITEISLSSVTEQYLEYIAQLDNLDPLELNRFIELASQLIYVKSRALLPVLTDTEEDDQLEELSQQLERYRHYRQAASYLEDLLRQGHRSWERPVKPQPLPTDLADLKLQLSDLQTAFAKALDRQAPPPETAAIDPLPTLEETSQQVRQFVADGGHQLSQLFGQATSRETLILTFIAILELIKSGGLRVTQAEVFGSITVKP